MQAAPPQGSRFYIPSLDALRFFAFFGVFLMHGSNNRLSDYGFAHSIWDNFYIGVHSALGYGVSVFYCLSAFLITTLLIRERELSGSIHILRFYGRRILRIWPVYFLALLIAAVGIPWYHHQHYERHWLRPFSIFTGNLHIGQFDLAPLSIAVLWSVCVEEQFYLVWPWVVRLLDRQWLERFCLVIVVLAPLNRAYGAQGGVVEWDIWFKTSTHLDCFAMGALLALNWNTAPVQRLRPYRWLIILGAWLLLVVQSAYAPFAGITDISLGPLQAASYSLVAFGSTCIVGGVALCGINKAATPFVLGGKVSYGLYSYHGIVFDLSAPTIAAWPWIAGMGFRFAVVAACAAASFFLIEAPLLKLKGRLQVVKSGSSTPITSDLKPDPV